MLSKSFIESEIAKIIAADGDYEAQHGIEDDLKDAFIQSLAERKDRIGELAKLIMTTKEIDFSRWTS